MTGRAFLDTNVFVYLYDSDNPLLGALEALLKRRGVADTAV